MTVLLFIAHHWISFAVAALLCVGIASNPVMALTLLRKYWQYLLAAVLLWVAYEAGYRSAGVACQHAAMQADLKHQKDMVAQVAADRAALDKALAERQATQEQLNKLAALPPKVIERVRTNPSHCVLPRPVTDGLREQAGETNTAIRLRRTSRAAGK